MEKLGTFYQFSNDRINITLIWVWFSNKVLTIKKMKKINLSKVILKLECLFYLYIYILFYLILYSKSHFDSNKSKKRSNRKKNTPYISMLHKIIMLYNSISDFFKFICHLIINDEICINKNNTK
jgi:hypothetical protein